MKWSVILTCGISDAPILGHVTADAAFRFDELGGFVELAKRLFLVEMAALAGGVIGFVAEGFEFEMRVVAGNAGQKVVAGRRCFLCGFG